MSFQCTQIPIGVVTLTIAVLSLAMSSMPETRPFPWSAKKQPTVAGSSTEARIHVASHMLLAKVSLDSSDY